MWVYPESVINVKIGFYHEYHFVLIDNDWYQKTDHKLDSIGSNDFKHKLLDRLLEKYHEDN